MPSRWAALLIDAACLAAALVLLARGVSGREPEALVGGLLAVVFALAGVAVNFTRALTGRRK